MQPEPQTLREALLLRAASDPDRLAYDDELRRITFGELAEAAALRARQLAEMGVKAGDRVALALPSGVPFAEAFWGIQMLGATSCAFNPAVPEQTLARRTALVRPRVLIREGDLEAAPVPASTPPEPDLGPEDLAFLQPTSGTTGEPRAVMIRHRNVLACMWANAVDAQIRYEDVLVNWVPPWHDLGLVRARGDGRTTSYSLTRRGTTALTRWLRETPVDFPVLKHPVALRLLLGALVDPATIVALLEEHLGALDEERAELEKVRVSLEGVDRPGDPFRYPALVADWGISYFEHERAIIEDLLVRIAAEES